MSKRVHAFYVVQGSCGSEVPNEQELQQKLSIAGLNGVSPMVAKVLTHSSFPMEEGG